MKINPFGNYLKKIFINENIPHTPSNVGVLQRIIFFHTQDEAMSGGLAKACFPGKNCSVSEKIEFFIEYQTEWEVYIHLNILHVLIYPQTTVLPILILVHGVLIWIFMYNLCHSSWFGPIIINIKFHLHIC